MHIPGELGRIQCRLYNARLRIPTSRKGDAEDREKLRKKADEERKNKQRQMLLDRVEDEVIAQFKLVGAWRGGTGTVVGRLCGGPEGACVCTE